MKYLHTMVRVTDIEQSLRFYRDALGLRKNYRARTIRRAATRWFFWRHRAMKRRRWN